MVSLVYFVLLFVERRCLCRRLSFLAKSFSVATKLPLFISSSEKSTLLSEWPLEGSACFAKISTAQTTWWRACLFLQLIGWSVSNSFVSILSSGLLKFLRKWSTLSAAWDLPSLLHEIYPLFCFWVWSAIQVHHPCQVLLSMVSGMGTKLTNQNDCQLLNHCLYLADLELLNHCLYLASLELLNHCLYLADLAPLNHCLYLADLELLNHCLYPASRELLDHCLHLADLELLNHCLYLADLELLNHCLYPADLELLNHCLYLASRELLDHCLYLADLELLNHCLSTRLTWNS